MKLSLKPDITHHMPLLSGSNILLPGISDFSCDYISLLIDLIILADFDEALINPVVLKELSPEITDF